MTDRAKRMMGRIFAAMFLVVSLALVAMSVLEFARTFYDGHGQELISGVVRAINTAVIALATFELGVGIGKEYTVPEDNHGLYPLVRRTVTRFVSVVCIALVLEGLIMVIKYSQLELAGNLYYPVAIIVGSSVLLMGLGLFIHLTRPDMAQGAAMDPAGGGADAARPPSPFGVTGGWTPVHGGSSAPRRPAPPFGGSLPHASSGQARGTPAGRDGGG